MATKYDWPAQGDRLHIGTRHNRLDGPWKVRGTAEYAYDRNLNHMLYAVLVTSPHAHAKILRIDLEAAKKVKGYRAAELIKDVGAELQWQHQEILAIAADTEEAARDCAAAVKVEYDVLPHLVHEEDVKAAGQLNRVQPAKDESEGDPDAAFADADETIEGYYGLATIAHSCLEPHGQVVDWTGDEIRVYASTQAVHRLGADLAKGLSDDERFEDVKASQIRVTTPVMGGGFGSKFNIDTWGIACAKLSKTTGHPVKLMLDRDQEMAVAGGRPSDYGNVRMAAKKDGTITAYEAETWSTGGVAGRGSPPLPYVFADIPNQKIRHLSVATNTGPARAWRAPNHPQAAVLTMCAMTDMAEKLGIDPVDFFKKNLGLTPRADVYSKEIDKAAEMIGWSRRYHKAGEEKGRIRRGVGLSIHTWQGRPHDSTCEVTIGPDGSVTASIGTQDLGVGARTVVAVVLAETVGMGIDDVTVNIGDSIYPISGASGGSTTVGGISASTRRAAVNAVEALKETVAADLGAESADGVDLKDGKLFSKADPSKSMTWADACKKLGTRSIVEGGKQPDRRGGKLNDAGVGGAQMAAVAVDVETGVVTMEEMVAVQDVGLVISLNQAESQVYGAMIMGICSALYEERVYDQQTGAMLNPDMEFYKLAGIGDIGELKVHMVQGEYDDRGVIGLGEPPAISPCAAISNAVANALGVRVPTLPMTAERVLAAIEKGGVA